MRGITRLVLACTLTTVSACASEPTAPTSVLRTPNVTARYDVDPNRLEDGTCRNGYIVANGRCVLI